MTDDMGDGDLGCYGATKIKLPNIDRLSRDGLRFTVAVCTGKWNWTLSTDKANENVHQP